MADSQLNALFVATLRTKVIPLLIEPLSADREGIERLELLVKMLADRPEADSHAEWRDLNARSPG